MEERPTFSAGIIKKFEKNTIKANIICHNGVYDSNIYIFIFLSPQNQHPTKDTLVNQASAYPAGVLVLIYLWLEKTQQATTHSEPSAYIADSACQERTHSYTVN